MRLSKNRIVSILPRSVSFVNFKQVANVLRYDGKKVFDAVRLFFKKKRIFPCKLFPYGGELWFRINRATLSGIMEFINLNPQYHDYMETVAVPDEIYFNTLICNLYNYQGSNLTFINWTGGNSPEWIDDKSIIEEKISNPRILFARKFNSNHILNFIDKEIGG